jgi:hypothetical protein
MAARRRCDLAGRLVRQTDTASLKSLLETGEPLPDDA